MDNNTLIIVIVVIAFLLLGCSCSCKGKTKENFGGFKKRLNKKLNKKISKASRKKNWNNSLIIKEFCKSNKQCMDKTGNVLYNSLINNLTSVGKLVYHDLSKSAGASMVEKNCARKFKGNQYKKCVKNTQSQLKKVLIGPLTKAGMHIYNSL